MRRDFLKKKQEIGKSNFFTIFHIDVLLFPMKMLGAPPRNSSGVILGS
jgi:hypothetical protein